MVSKVNRKFFYDTVRITLFEGSLKKKQVEGLNVFLNYWEDNFASLDDRWLAYMLGTAHHEVDRKMQPIKEYGGKSYFMKNYDKSGLRPDKAKELGNTIVGDGATFHGRGYVQLTGRRNYQDMKNRLGVDLVNQPDLALNTKIATRIIFEGMMEGSFTGKKLSDYLNLSKQQWKNARKTVNGLNKASLIAGYAILYYRAISYTVA